MKAITLFLCVGSSIYCFFLLSPLQVKLFTLVSLVAHLIVDFWLQKLVSCVVRFNFKPASSLYIYIYIYITTAAHTAYYYYLTCPGTGARFVGDMLITLTGLVPVNSIVYVLYLPCFAAFTLVSIASVILKPYFDV